MKGNSTITLNQSAVRNNVAFLRKKFGKNVTISSVVKANAYGHCIEHLVPMLEKEGITHFSVFDFDEAVRVSKSLSSPQNIMIMGFIADNNIRKAINSGFEFYIFSLARLNIALEEAKELNIKAKIHIEVETGMNRTGLNLQQLKQAITIINNNTQHLEIMGFCTHLAGAESISNHLRIQRQLKWFYKLLKLVTDNNITPKYKHVANSAASIVYPKTRMDLVRIGIMTYGFWSSAETFIQYISTRKDKTDPLKRILDWKSQVMSIKDILVGEFVGYGISYQAQSPMKTALVPIGYSNGYSRSLSNKGQVLINGKRCNIIGMVNMNMIIVDVTNTNNVKEGDEVVIIGNQDDLEIKVNAFSDSSNQLNYEVLSHLPIDIERIITQ